MSKISPPRLILASASPRRLELLRSIGVTPAKIQPTDIDETPTKGELPRRYVIRMAVEKSAAAAETYTTLENSLLLSADTTVAVGRRILGKPENIDEASAFLDLLEGRRHRVLTAVTLLNLKTAENWVELVEAQVKMKRLSAVEKHWYLQTNEWQGKAGGYGIQGAAAAFITWMSGSYSTIVGLPVAETAAILDAAGYPVFQQ